MNNLNKEIEDWCENIIVVDADYVDGVTLNLRTNFGRMIGREIPTADIAHWLDCIALDGGVTLEEEGKSQFIEVIFIYNKETMALQNFRPGNIKKDLTDKAFKDNLGEFVMNSYPVEAQTTKDDFLLDVVKTAANHKDVKRLMVVANCDDGVVPELLNKELKDVDANKMITVFAMTPASCGKFKTEILGYSLMSALGIRSDEVK